MKSKLSLILAITISIAGCKKPAEDPPSSFTILESNSNMPLESVLVKGYKCFTTDVLRDCQAETLVGSAITNSNGVATFAVPGIGAIRISKERYWDNSNSFVPFSNPMTYLMPIATLKVHVIKANSYPASQHLIVYEQTGKCWECQTNGMDLGQPVDTTFYMKGRGNIQNHISWVVNTGGVDNIKNSVSEMAHRFDTVHVDIRY